MRVSLLVVSSLAALALAGCANRSENAYGPSQYSGSSCGPGAGIIGGLAGAAGGGLLGNQFGGGTGKSVATGLGVGGGGAAGYELGNRMAGC